MTGGSFVVNDTGRKGSDRPTGEIGSGASRIDLDVPFSLQTPANAHLLTTRKRVGVWPAALVCPPGAAPPERSCPAQDIPADANGGLCIGRSCADALGAWGPSATNKRHRVYTGALLATTIQHL